MSKKFSWKRLGLTLSLLLTLVVIGCSGGEDASSNEEPKEIELAYVAWASEIASTNVIAKVLEDEGYNVTMTQLKAGPMWSGVAEGDADALVAAWLPATHASYYEDFKDSIDDLGANLEGAKIGLVVPSYVDATTIADLNNIVTDLDGKITGIDAGAGVMKAASSAIEEYDLALELQSSSSAAMTQALATAIEDNAAIVVTGWTPHWKFAKYDLKYLEDPKGVFGGEEKIHTIARKGLKEDMPKAHKILDQFNWTAADMESVMLEIQNGAEPAEAAANWVESNQDKVSEWVK